MCREGEDIAAAVMREMTNGSRLACRIRMRVHGSHFKRYPTPAQQYSQHTHARQKR